MSVITDARDRLMDLCETIVLPDPFGTPHAFRTRGECSFTTDTLPAFVVEGVPNANRNTRISVNDYVMQRDFTVIMALAAMKHDAYEKNMDAWDQVNDCILTVTDFFMGNPELSLDDAGIVGMAEVVRDSGAIPIAGKKDGKYYGAVFRITVTFPRFVTRD
jgi:hypothetical protein